MTNDQPVSLSVEEKKRKRKEESRPVWIAVLGHGQLGPDLDLDQSTKLRIRRAIELAMSIRGNGCLAGFQPLVWLLFMAGMDGGGESGKTMASLMREHALAVMEEKGVTIPAYANHDRPEVWGTILEMGWVQEMAQRMSGQRKPERRVIFVTNERHGKRVLRTNDLIHQIPRCTVEVSSDEPPPWWHEALAYLKLGACLIGFGRPAEAFRRKYYTR